ncbi:MAG: hypothetical protein BZ133_01640 [Methanosphaera sp. SHI613]|jgi:4-carboxymuconolactone decarboxylase|nr:MAG: hypothetical protein BZ133_01640 [Methanosphaera sp. SHI613]
MNENINLLEKIYSNMNEYDPEFSQIIKKFMNNDVLSHINLSDKEIALVTLSTLIANQSTKIYEEILPDALNILTPVEIKEVIYQSTIYIGLAKCYEFLEISNQCFKKENIDLPLESQTTIKYEDRQKTGYDLQVRNFSKEFIDTSIENTPDNQKYTWDLISGFAYGDFYTRSGLDDKERELITFAFILSLRGCENQLKIHTIGNIKMGNDKQKLVDTVSILIAFIGFPRMHNALAIINEVDM